MKSRFEHLREKAMKLRRGGNSIGSIETRLGIPRSTLSYWFRGVVLSDRQKKILEKRWKDGLITARTKASAWHRADKKARVIQVEKSAEEMLRSLDIKDTALTELALAFLYLGEGSKKNCDTSLGSSDPKIAQFFVTCLKNVYAVPIEKIRCDLHLRADQNPETMKRYWAKELGLPSTNFCKPVIDKRTEGKPTYQHYKGVCAIRCGRVEIQRRLMYIASSFCDKIADTKGG
jgi:hypothetical protein